jgi:sarcosine oxidase
MPNETYDLVVVGLGVVGSSVLLAAARRGLKVCGIEQFELGHGNGSSHGESRIIRKAYFLHPDYVPLLERVYPMWQELEEEAQEELMVLNGLICAGSPGEYLIEGLQKCYSSHSLPHERLTAKEAMSRWLQ